MNKLRYVASFSGGKDSTAMLLMLLENGVHIDDIVFADTGLEFPEIYKHIEKVEKYIGRKVTRVYPKRDFGFYMLEHKKTKGKNAGDAGYGWPGFSNRWCNRVLKIDPIDKYLREFKEETVIQYLGISYDEAHRAKNNPLYKYPLIEAKMTSEDNLQFCLDRGFDWGGIYDKLPRTGCWLCPLQRIGTLKMLYLEYPELWEELKRLDKTAIEKGRIKFLKNYSVEKLDLRFKSELAQTKLN